MKYILVTGAYGYATVQALAQAGYTDKMDFFITEKQ